MGLQKKMILMIFFSSPLTIHKDWTDANIDEVSFTKVKSIDLKLHDPIHSIKLSDENYEIAFGNGYIP